MNKIAAIIVLFFFLSVPLANAHENERKCVSSMSTIDANNWGNIFEDPNRFFLTEVVDDDGFKQVSGNINVISDAGFFTLPFLIFELPSFCTPVIFGKLRLKVNSAIARGTIDPTVPPFPFVLYDVVDLLTLQKPAWDFDDFQNVVSDLTTGRIYGNFIVRSSPTDDGMVIEIPLTYDAMYDINSAAGGTFAIAISPTMLLGPNVGWIGEGDVVDFASPDDGGLIQLELTMIPASGGKPRHHYYRHYLENTPE